MAEQFSSVAFHSDEWEQVFMSMSHNSLLKLQIKDSLAIKAMDVEPDDPEDVNKVNFNA
jgi:hypothetical protein